MSRLVRRTLADSPMTPARKRKLARLVERPDSEIDFSEIPPLTESFWKKRRPQSFLSACETAAHGTPGRRCGGLAPPAGEGLPNEA